MGSVCVFKDRHGEAILIHLFRRVYWRIHKYGYAENVAEDFQHLIWRVYWLKRTENTSELCYVEETVFGTTPGPPEFKGVE